jgi:hypothetical protein
MTTIAKYLNLQKKQLQIEVEAIRLLMQHASSKGTEAEIYLAELLRKYLPKKYSIGSGFVSEKEKLSPQIDIIIYDELLNVPIYKGGSSGVFKAGSVYGCIEVTLGKLTHKKLEDDIKKLAQVRSILKNNQVRYEKIFSKPDGTGKGFVVAKKPISSGPPPRTYICALSGTTFSSPERLSVAVKKLTKKYKAHMHGVLVIESSKSKSPEKEWLIWTKAFRDYETKYITKDSLYALVNKMNTTFLGMYVGVYPAAD